MNIIGAGYGRTGTLTLKLALEQLGFGPCYHMEEVIRHPGHVKVWQAAAEGETMDWPRIFEAYQSTVDWPGCTCYQDLMQAFPDAKVILTVRDPERWYDSARQTIFQMNKDLPPWTKWVLPPLVRYNRMVRALVWDGTFNGRFSDRHHAIQIFNQHNEQVKQVVPPQKLLIFQVQDGWEPLCRFLQVPVPAGLSFPHVNDRKVMQKRIGLIRTLAWAMPIIILTAVLLLFFLLRNVFA